MTCPPRWRRPWTGAAPSSPWKPTNDTDFLNLYQASTATAVNAEILLLIDQSGSTSRLMFHQLFPNNWLDEKPPNGPSDSQDYTIIIRNSDSNWGTSGGVLTNTLSVGFATDYSTTSVLSTISASGHTYYIGGARGTSVIGGVTYPYNTLIKPDGTEVTAANVTASCVCHVRCNPGAPHPQHPPSTNPRLPRRLQSNLTRSSSGGAACPSLACLLALTTSASSPRPRARPAAGLCTERTSQASWCRSWAGCWPTRRRGSRQ